MGLPSTEVGDHSGIVSTERLSFALSQTQSVCRSVDIGFNAVPPPPPQLLFIAHLAQKVERWPFKPMVVGSIPTVGGRPVCILRGNRYNLQQLSDWLHGGTSSTQVKIICENILDLV